MGQKNETERFSMPWSSSPPLSSHHSYCTSCKTCWLSLGCDTNIAFVRGYYCSEREEKERGKKKTKQTSAGMQAGKGKLSGTGGSSVPGGK